MSANVGEHQAHHALSSIAPRKRPRQESGCDVDSGLGDSEGGGGSGSGVSESSENGDARQGGSQKRARSEGHGDAEVSRDTISWHRNADSRSTSNQVNAPIAVVASSTRLSAGSSTTPRYDAGEAFSSEESFIPLPPVSSTPEVRPEGPDYGSSLPVEHTVRDDLARSMAFDEQIDVLRRSPVSIPSSPIQRDSHSAAEPHSAIETEPSPSSEGTSVESIGELDASEHEHRVRNEADRPNMSGRLHALADTASMHSRILHAPASRAIPTLPPILPLFPSEIAPATSGETSPSMLPRLRILRRQEQSHSQPRSVTHPSSPNIEQDPDQALSGYMETFGRTDETLRSSIVGGMAHLSSISAALPPSSPSGTRQTIHPPYPASSRSRRSLTRRDLLHDMHSPFDPFELDDRPFPELTRDPMLPSLGFRIPLGRRSQRPTSPPASHNPSERSLGLIGSHRDSTSDHDAPDVTMEDQLIGPGQGTPNISVPRDDAPGTLPWTQAGRDRLSGSFWTSIFDDTDSERDGSPRRPTSFVDDTRRSRYNAERDPRMRSVYDMFRNETRRRSSFWDSPRRASVQSESDHIPHTTSSSSSSISSYGRSTSRSLLDPTLSFGSGSSVVNSRSSLSSTPGQEQEIGNRARPRPRTRLGSWFDERRMEEDEDEDEPLGVHRSAPESERRRGEGLTTFSSFFTSIESPRNEERSSLPGPPSRHLSHLRGSRSAQVETSRSLSVHLPPADQESPSRSTYDSERSVTVAPRARSPDLWDNASVTPDPIDSHRRQSMRQHFASATAERHPPTPSAGRDTDHPFSPASFGLGELPLPVASRFRLRRPASQDQNLTSSRTELPVDSMEDIIPESNAREIHSANPPFRSRRSSSPFVSNHPPFPRIEPPPRPVEPRLTWHVEPRHSARVPTRPRSPSLTAPSRQGHDVPDVIDTAPIPPVRPQRPSALSYRSMFDRSVAAEHEHLLAQRHSTSSIDGDERREVPHVAPTHLDGSPNQSSDWPPPSPDHQVPGTPRVESFNELVRRRAARAEAQARANRRPPSPETTLRPAYRLPRPSFLHDDEDSAIHRDYLPRIDRRDSSSLPGRTSTMGGSSLAEESRRERLERQRAALLLERSISSRYTFGDRHINLQEWDRYYDNLLLPPAQSGRPQSNDPEEQNIDAGTSVRTRILERNPRQASFSSPMEQFGSENTQEREGARERLELHDAIGRRSRDDELSTRRSLPNADRTRHINHRDPMSVETTRNLQRRLRESEATVGRALRALDQWGELEGSGDRDFDPTQSRMHRFGETLRRRRVPPAFSFADTSTDQDPVPGPGSSSTGRTGRRSPSPTTAATRLQTRQARFARAQGRFREMGTDLFGESRSRGTYASRLDLLGGSRFASRYMTRNLGDYMRDEDFDASYENLVRLAASVGEAKPRGTPAHLLAAMPTGFYKDFATPGCDSRCPICLDDYKDLDSVLRISDCDHWFHKECLEQWLSGEDSCPICRRRIRGHAQQEPPPDAPGPSGSRRDDGSDDDGPGNGPGGTGRTGSPGLTLEELSSYAATW